MKTVRKEKSKKKTTKKIVLVKERKFDWLTIENIFELLNKDLFIKIKIS